MLFPQRFGVLVLAVLATLVSVGFVHGLWTNRWAANFADQEIAEMEKMPLVVGTWHGQTMMDESSKQLLKDTTTYLSRRYVNHLDGTVASVMLTRGRPGPLVIKHLPTECYISSGYEMVGEPKHVSKGQKNDEFWVATFKKTTDVSPVIQRVYWSWTADGHWQTPDRPRLAFAKYNQLYKIYFVQPLLNETEPLEGAPVNDLIEKLTDSMRGTLFPAEPR